ncbi:MAG TPA: cell division protein FtsZ [Chloroflexota bacterium]|nr:cell division protein FtsZ [Chloroflexota bacterium]
MPESPQLPPRKESGGFNPSRLPDPQRTVPVVPRIVGAGVPAKPLTAPAPVPLAPSASPAQRAQQEARPHAENKGFTEVRIVGVGGGGGNAVNRMIEAGVSGVEFIAVNTDPQALEQSQATRTLRIGSAGARRLGAGGDPGVGQRAAEESEDNLADAVAGADMVFITAGMGGGTGTGAAPVIARLARKHGALTVGVVTLPFAFEGARRRQSALEGIAHLRDAVDALIVIPNDRLLSISDRHTSVKHAFRMADDMLRHGVQGIADLVTVTGLINLDFADVRSVMENAGSALMAIGEANGNDRARQAAEAVVSSPLLEHSIAGATGILLSITGGADLTLHEVSEVADYVTQAVAPEANIIFGATIHPRPEAELRVTLIATGMEESATAGATPQRQPAKRDSEPLRPVERAREREIPRERDRGVDEFREREALLGRSSTRDRGEVGLPDDVDPVDVPAFLRRTR